MKTIEELKAEALAKQKPAWPYPGGPDFRPDNFDNLRDDPDGTVKCRYKGDTAIGS
jgi:hypothetical protein